MASPSFHCCERVTVRRFGVPFSPKLSKSHLYPGRPEAGPLLMGSYGKLRGLTVIFDRKCVAFHDAPRGCLFFSPLLLGGGLPPSRAGLLVNKNTSFPKYCTRSPVQHFSTYNPVIFGRKVAFHHLSIPSCFPTL